MQEVVPINTTDGTDRSTRVARALSAEDGSVRLQAALAAGTHPDPAFLEALVGRCAVEPDFFVRDMLSWALTRLPPEVTLPRVRRELGAERAQARSQALHTLSKIGDRSAWAWITRGMLRDADDEVARTAWRVAVVLVPEEEKEDLAGELAGQLGRGDREVRLSLSRALIDLGDVTEPVLAKASASPTRRSPHMPAPPNCSGGTRRRVSTPPWRRRSGSSPSAPRTPPRPTRRRRGPWIPTRPRRPPSADR